MKTSGQREKSITTGHLLILGCSKRKSKTSKSAPALDLYDGVNFRVIRKSLLTRGWPPGLQIKVVSAKYGLIDATKIVAPYDLRLDPRTASSMKTGTLSALGPLDPPASVFVNMGADYLPAVDGIEGIFPRSRITYARGSIGKRMRAMKRWLEHLPCRTACLPGRSPTRRSYLYFFPDWDDYVYEPYMAYETEEDRKSSEARKTYAHELFGEQTPYDGVLLSLSHMYVGKGALHRLNSDDGRPVDLRKELRIPKHTLLFGDCGAFSYASEPSPPFSPEEAGELYERFGFDIGASVDHIPLPEVIERLADGSRRKRQLSLSTRYQRMRITQDNAARFLQLWKQKKYSFVPLGAIQGIGTRSYVSCLHNYIDMGYRHVALGGLVPRSDGEILEILCAVRRAIQSRTRGVKENLWVHLFGLLRPKLQRSFQSLGISSFDSASYFRKAWLRADQNYLGPDGKWYAAIRIPFANSKRMREVARKRSISSDRLRLLERECLEALERFGKREHNRQDVLDAVDCYGPLLPRCGEDNHFAEKYAQLLTDRPWEKCRCCICRAIGVNVVVFRGANRNKRRGLHNTWVFYHKVLHGNSVPTSVCRGHVDDRDQ